MKLTVVSDAALKRELPAKFRSRAAVAAFVPGPAPVQGEFLLEDSGDRPVAREVAVMIMRSLVQARGYALKVKQLDCDDPAVIADQLEMRLADLPVRLTVKPGTAFTLDVVNRDSTARTVCPGEFALPKNWPKHPFPDRAELFNLAPGRSAHVEIVVSEVSVAGDKSSNPGGLIAYAVSADPLEVGAANPLTVVPRKWRLAFSTHGYASATDVLRRVVTDVLDRFRKLDFGRLAVEAGDQLAAVFKEKITAPLFSVPLGYDAPPGAALLLARLIFAPLDGGSSEFVAPSTDHRNEAVVRLAAVDKVAAAAAVERARGQAVAALESVLLMLARAQ